MCSKCAALRCYTLRCFVCGLIWHVLTCVAILACAFIVARGSALRSSVWVASLLFGICIRITVHTCLYNGVRIRMHIHDIRYACWRCWAFVWFPNGVTCVALKCAGLFCIAVRCYFVCALIWCALICVAVLRVAVHCCALISSTTNSFCAFAVRPICVALLYIDVPMHLRAVLQTLGSFCYALLCCLCMRLELVWCSLRC